MLFYGSLFILALLGVHISAEMSLLPKEQEIEAILNNLGLQEVKAKFLHEKIYASTVPMLTDEQLKELGVSRMGDRTALIEACKRAQLGSKVSEEVKRIMQPSLPLRNNSESRVGTLDRRSRFRSSATCKRRTSIQQSFSKKLIVFKCMSPKSPKSFPRKEADIITRGFIGDVLLDSTEEEIRQEIYEVLHNAGLKSIGPKDFEFIDVNGRTGCVLSKKEGSQFSGRAIKQVAGTGAIYIRLLKHPVVQTSDSSEDDQSLPPLPFTFRKKSITDHFRNDADHSMSSEQQCSSAQSSKCPEGFVNEPSTSYTTTQVVESSSHPLTSESETTNDVTKPLSSSVCDLTKSNLSEATSRTPELYTSDIKQLQQAFPNFPPEFIADLYMVSKYDFAETLECLLDGNLSSVLTLINAGVLGGSPADLSISITSLDDKDELIASAFQFYKRHQNLLCDLTITLKTQPAIDAGGVRRAFFSKVFQHVAEGYLGIFEGPPNRLRPSYKMSTLNSGVLKTLGQMIGHSLLLDKLGFPYLSPPCYYYMAGKWDTAVTYITNEDVSSKVHNVLAKLREGIDFSCDDDYKEAVLELLEQSGSDIALKEENQEKIHQSLLVYDALIKRKPFLDNLSEGLEAFKIKTIISSYPKLFEKKFIGRTYPVNSHEIKAIIRTASPPGNHNVKLQLLHYLGKFIDESTEKDLCKFLLFCTGSQEVVCNNVTIQFTSDPEAAGIKANTCSRELTLSLLMTPPSALTEGLKAIINGNDSDTFTTL